MPQDDLGNVIATFECKASDAEWRVIAAEISEELNQPYHLRLTLRTEDVETDPTEMLGEPCKVVLERNDLVTQYPAIIHWIEDSAGGESQLEISIEASAAFWMLSQNRQTRVFQQMTVPDILNEVLGSGLSGYGRKHEVELGREYPSCEYRVQYDESDFAFCQRLMEEEGILYRFDREDDAEVLLLTDDPHGGDDVESADGKEVRFSPAGSTQESIQSIVRHSAMKPTKLTMRSFNWTRPSLAIEQEKEGTSDGNEADGSAIGPLREIYEHDLAPPTLCDYNDDDGYQSHDAAAQCEVRRDLWSRDKRILLGESSVIGFHAGGKFTLVDHDLEGDFTLTGVTHSFSFGGEAVNYSNRFGCIPADSPYRPARRTPKPRISGIETATVVGPAGQEIHTDKHGRIKVQFHWDREGQRDEHASCFIRVVQPWAGAGWGFVFIPRIGMEVTVAFVQGDPDRPVITGTVYNGENLTSYEMPHDMTKSTIRTNSSPGGGGYNELTFEDKAGEEEIFLHAQKDLRENVKENQATDVGTDQSVSVGNDQTLTVKNNRTTEVGNDKNETVKNNKTTHVIANHDETVGGNVSQAVGGTKNETVAKAKSSSVGTTLNEVVGSMKSMKVGGLVSEQVGASRSCVAVGAWSATAGLSAKLQAAKDITVKAQGGIKESAAKKLEVKSGDTFTQSSDKDMSISAKKDLSLSGGKKGVIEIKDELTIKVGSAQITMKKNGDIVIKGAKINVKGSGDVVIKGSKVGVN